MKLKLIVGLSILLLLPFVTAETCYQEHVNVATSCGGLSTGNYTAYGNWDINYNNAFDGNWISFGRLADTTSGGLYINYTIPTNATQNTIWMYSPADFQQYNQSFNTSPFSDCLLGGVLQFWVNSSYHGNNNSMNTTCWTGTDWAQISYLDDTDDRRHFLEEGMFWDINSSHWANLSFTGSASGSDYSETVYCTQGGVEVRRSGGLWELPYGNSTYVCTGTDDYPAFNHSFWNINGTPQYSETIIITEYAVTLDFDTNVTGTVFWGCENLEHCQEILQDSTRYNPATYNYTYSPSTWDEDIMIVFYWNNQSYGNNASAQYYELINEQTQTNTHVYLTELSTLDFNLWLEVLNYGEEVLYGSTVRAYYNPNETYAYTLVGQRITQAISGDAMQGPLFYLDRTLSYTLTINHPGYKERKISIRGYDFDSDLKLKVKLLPEDLSISYDYIISGPQTHHNQTSLDYTITHADGGTYYYSTTYRSARTERTFTNGGDTITLTTGVDYEPSTNFTLSIYSRNETSGVYTLETTHDITYQEWDQNDFTTQLSSTNNVLNILLWIAIIAVSSIIGFVIKKDNIDTGYYAYNAATFIAAIFNLFFLPIAILNGIVLIGSLITNVIRD